MHRQRGTEKEGRGEVGRGGRDGGMRGRDGGGCPGKQATPLLALMKEGEKSLVNPSLATGDFFQSM